MCKGGSSGGGSSTVTQTSQLDPTVSAAYKDLITQAQNIAGPNAQYQQYGGQMVAGLTPEQTNAIGSINASQGLAQPYYNTAAGLASQSATPLTPTQFSAGQVQQYMDPYLSNVVNATQANINANNAIQQQQLLGQAVQSGASPFGGDRAGVAAAELARQQNLAGQQTIANLYSQGYGQALGEFNTQQQTGLAAQQQNAANAANAAQLYGGLGTAAQQSALSGSAAQLQAGTLEQQQNQNELSNAYNQWLQQTYYPFQTTSYLANIVEGIGNQFPQSSTQTSTPASPSLGGQIAGGVTAGLGILGASGAFGSNGWLFKEGGSVGMAGLRDLPGLAGGRLHAKYGADTNEGGAHGFSGGNSGHSSDTHGSGHQAAISQASQGASRAAPEPSSAAGDRTYRGLPTTHYNEYGKPTGWGQVEETGWGAPVHYSYDTPGAAPTRLARDPQATRALLDAVKDFQNTGNSPAENFGNMIAGQAGVYEKNPVADPLRGPYQNQANWNLDPMQVAASVAGMATQMPIGSLYGAGTEMFGHPSIGQINLGPDVFGSAPSLPANAGYPTGGGASPTSGKGTQTGTTVLPNATGGPGAVVGPVSAQTPSGTPGGSTAPSAPTVTPFQNPPTVIPQFGDFALHPTPYGGVSFPTYGPGQFGPVSQGGLVTMPGHFAPGGGVDNYDMPSWVNIGPYNEAESLKQGRAAYDNPDAADADPAPYWDTSGGTAQVSYPSNGEKIDTGLPVPSREQSIGEFFDNPWLGVAEAGLGMLASGSPYAGVAIGQGGLTGLQQYEQGRASAAETALRRQQAENERQQAELTGMTIEGYKQLQGLYGGGDQSGGAPAEQGAMPSGGLAGGAPMGGAPMMGGTAPTGNVAGLPPTAPNIKGPAIPTISGVQGGPNPAPMFDVAGLSRQAQIAMATPGMQGMASSILGMITKGVPEGMYLGKDGALYPRQGYLPTVQAKAMYEKGYVPNSAGGWTMDPGMFASETALAGSKAGAAAAAEYPYKVVEGLMTQAGTPHNVSSTEPTITGLQALPPALQNVVNQAISGLPGGAPVPQNTAPLPAPQAQPMPAPQAAPAPATAPPMPAPQAAPQAQSPVSPDKLPEYLKGATDQELATLAQQAQSPDIKAAVEAEQQRRQPQQVAQGLTPAPETGGTQSPFVPGVAKGPNGELINTMTPAGQALSTAMAEKYIKVDTPAYQSAVNSQGQLDLIDDAIEQLNKNGWSSTGTLNPIKMNMAKAINSVETTFGKDPSFDPSTVASWEDLNKQTTRLGFELARTLGSREAMMIVQQATAAVPNSQNTYLGAKLVSQSIRQANQRTIDFYNFETQWLQDPAHRGNPLGAENEFNKTFPPSMYARRAIALARAPKEAVDYLSMHPETMPQFLETYGVK